MPRVDNEVRTTSKTNKEMPDNTAVDTKKVSEEAAKKDERKNEPTTAAAKGTAPEVRRAGATGERRAGGIKVTNRTDHQVRLTVENQNRGEWAKENHVMLAGDDTTEVVVAPGRRIIVEAI